MGCVHCGKVPAGSSDLTAPRYLCSGPGLAGKHRTRPHITVQSSAPRLDLYFSSLWILFGFFLENVLFGSDFTWAGPLFSVPPLFVPSPGHGGSAIPLLVLRFPASNPVLLHNALKFQHFPVCLLIHTTGTLPRQCLKPYKTIRILCTSFLQCWARRGRVCTSPCRSCDGEEKRLLKRKCSF